MYLQMKTFLVINCLAIITTAANSLSHRDNYLRKREARRKSLLNPESIEENGDNEDGHFIDKIPALNASKFPPRMRYEPLFRQPDVLSPQEALLSVTSQGDATLMSQSYPQTIGNSSYGITVAVNSKYAFIGNPDTYQGTGLVYIYKNIGQSWSYTQTLYMPNSYEESEDGEGGPGNENPSAYYYVNKGDGQQVITGYNSYFGNGLGLGTNYAIVGAPGYNYKTGISFIYKLNNVTSVWSLKQTIFCPSSPSPPPSTGAYTCAASNFGYSGAITDKIAVIGAPKLVLTTAQQPHGGIFAYVYNATLDVWSFNGQISSAVANAQWGHSVDAYGNYIVIGAPYYTFFAMTGVAVILQRIKTSWRYVVSIQSPQNKVYDFFGWSVSLSAGFAAVGNSCNNGRYNGGTTCIETVYLYSIECGNAPDSPATQTLVPIASSAVTNVQNMSFGYSVSINDNFLVVGAPLANNGKGATYIYELYGTTWTQTNVLSSTTSGEYGYAVAVSSTMSFGVITAPGQPSSSSLVGPGAAYFYSLSSQVSARPSPSPVQCPNYFAYYIQSATPTFLPTFEPTISPSTARPTKTPSIFPTCDPTVIPSEAPSFLPTLEPSVVPTVTPSMTPTYKPTTMPSFTPTVVPTQPTVNPSITMPTSQPSIQPSRQPEMQPTQQPSTQPCKRPSSQPSGQPLSYPSNQPSAQPSTKPSQHPSVQPSCQPSAKPSVQPSKQPLVIPTQQPSSQPTTYPSNQPSSQPSTLPTLQPSYQPSATPTNQPSVQPSNQPVSQSTQQPSLQPLAQPTSQPSGQPSTQPLMQPTTQPSKQPTQQPVARPTSQPSNQPSRQPTKMPSQQPSTQPTRQPTPRPSIQPSLEPFRRPSNQPSVQPTGHPSTAPSQRPSSQPTVVPTIQPISELTAIPSIQPSGIPTCMPSLQPTSQPNIQPSVCPLSQPSSNPSTQPTSCPTTIPSSQPTQRASVQPTSLPSKQPSQPIGCPLNKPSTQPSQQPSVKPVSMPSVSPTSTPLCLPSTQPFTQPLSQPSIHPSNNPSSQPSTSPSVFPSSQPSVCPLAQPTVQPTSHPSHTPQPSFMPTKLTIGTLPIDSPFSVSYDKQRVTKFKILLPYAATSVVLEDGLSNLHIQKPIISTGYLVFGSSSMNSIIAVDQEQNGVSFAYTNASISFDYSGRSVSNAGDINNDGFDDLIIGVPFASRCYVLFGTVNGFVNMTEGFTIFGAFEGDGTGWSVSSAGDVNNDSFADILIGAPRSGQNNAGVAYVLYGKRYYFANLHLKTLLPEVGFATNGKFESDAFGLSCSTAGDVNGDGFDDIVVGALLANDLNTGAAYVIYGQQDIRPEPLSVARMSFDQGFSVVGVAFQRLGYTVSAAGDVNGDGFGDILLGTAPQRAALPINCYLIYGKARVESNIAVRTFSINHGVQLVGVSVVSGYASDVDGDGNDDLVIMIDFGDNKGGGVIIVNQYHHVAMPSRLPSRLPSVVPSIGPSDTPILGSLRPSRAPSARPSWRPTSSTLPSSPTLLPTVGASRPTSVPSARPTSPTSHPTEMLLYPTETPTESPSLEASQPSSVPPNTAPSQVPSVHSRPPTLYIRPTRVPTQRPTVTPSLTIIPTYVVTRAPSVLIIYPTVVVVNNNVNSNHNITYSRSSTNTHFILNSSVSITITGLGGKDKFTVFPVKNVTYTVNYFNIQFDLINLTHFKNIHSMDDLRITGSAIINLPDGQLIHILNLVPDNMTAEHFVFAPYVPTPTVSNKQTTEDKVILGIGIACASLLVLFIVNHLYENLAPDVKELLTRHTMQSHRTMVVVTSLVRKNKVVDVNQLKDLQHECLRRHLLSIHTEVSGSKSTSEDSYPAFDGNSVDRLSNTIETNMTFSHQHASKNSSKQSGHSSSSSLRTKNEYVHSDGSEENSPDNAENKTFHFDYNAQFHDDIESQYLAHACHEEFGNRCNSFFYVEDGDVLSILSSNNIKRSVRRVSEDSLSYVDVETQSDDTEDLRSSPLQSGKHNLSENSRLIPSTDNNGGNSRPAVREQKQKRQQIREDHEKRGKATHSSVVVSSPPLLPSPLSTVLTSVTTRQFLALPQLLPPVSEVVNADLTASMTIGAPIPTAPSSGLSVVNNDNHRPLLLHPSSSAAVKFADSMLKASSVALQSDGDITFESLSMTVDETGIGFCNSDVDGEYRENARQQRSRDRRDRQKVQNKKDFTRITRPLEIHAQNILYELWSSDDDETSSKYL